MDREQLRAFVRPSWGKLLILVLVFYPLSSLVYVAQLTPFFTSIHLTDVILFPSRLEQLALGNGDIAISPLGYSLLIWVRQVLSILYWYLLACFLDLGLVYLRAAMARERVRTVPS